MSSTSYLRVNVVVVTYQNSQTIENVLESLEQEHDLIEQVVIQDNGSSDATLAVAREWCATGTKLNVTVVAGTNVGFAAGVFQGCKSFTDSSFPVLCLNPDLEVFPGTLVRLLDVLNTEPDAAIVTAPLVGEDGVMDTACIRRLPKLGTGLAYSLLGQFLPSRLKYNSIAAPERPTGQGAHTSVSYSWIEATTGALMLVNPEFRSSSVPVFDLSYWMYGEDLQLCWDAKSEGYKVAIIDYQASLHKKGTSSGWPRSKKSNAAFHEALAIYYSKNLSHGPLDREIIRAGMHVRLAVSLTCGRAATMLSALRSGRST
jgi:N-acetylglucosaminyl-diphospho-decaprenol L-rhamnosyltransferase